MDNRKLIAFIVGAAGHQVKPETVAVQVGETASASGKQLTAAAVSTPEVEYGRSADAHEVFEYAHDFQCEKKDSPRGGGCFPCDSDLDLLLPHRLGDCEHCRYLYNSGVHAAD
jgi:hypothetical protein